MRILAMDLGASKMQHGLWQGGRWSGMGRIGIRSAMDAKGLLKIIYGLADASKADCICLSAPGFVVDGKLANMPNLARVDGKRFMTGMRKLNIPFFIDNDVKCMALAEWAARGKKEKDDFLLLAPGSGIGGAIVREGRLARGAHNTAGEVGHLKVWNGKGGWIDWEAGCSGFGIERKFAKIGWDAKKILNSRNPGARRLAASAADCFGAGLAGLANALDPEEILVAGSVGRAYMRNAKLRRAVMAAYAQNAIQPVKKTPVRCVSLPYPALAGAALLGQGKKNARIRRFLS
ncbi:MAG: ROK family protein [Candidatus Marsarchaeota archaeon]|nr:ROK family protein [Candidatus Marsarchaeota archaeon]